MKTPPGLRRLLVYGLLLPLLASCATAPPQSAERYEPPAAAPPPELSPMASVLNVIAFPLYLCFKAAVCAATVVLAVPATAVTAVTDPEGTGWQRHDLAEGFATNCSFP